MRSDRLPTPKSWETSLEVPTLHRVIDAAGKKRIIMFSGLYPINTSDYEHLKANLAKLQLNDSAFIYQAESSVALGNPDLVVVRGREPL